jgi:hypothetical protein
MPAPRASFRPFLRIAPSTRDLRAGLDVMSPEDRRLARTAGTALAVLALITAFAASAQTAVSGAQQSNGALAWLFAIFAAVAVLGVFLVVLALVRGPAPQNGHLPGTARRR